MGPRQLCKVAFLCLGVIALAAVTADGQPPVAPDTLPAPRSLGATGPISPALWEDGHLPVMPIDLPSALRLAQTANLDIAQAREFVNQIRAAELRADALALPDLNFSSTYVNHQGQIQRTEGNIITVNRDSLWVGGGPQLSWQSADAIFAPLVARQVTRASEANVQRVTNDVLLLVADAYFNVLRARRRLARTDEVLSFLLDEQQAAQRGNAKGLLPLIRDVIAAGGKGAFPADLERVRVEVLRRQDERRTAIQELEVATAELARVLHIDPRVILWPVEDYRQPMVLPGEAWFHQPIDVLVGMALQNRPELAQNRALVEAALNRVRTAHWRPFMPNFTVGYGYGGFGGGPNIDDGVVGPSGVIDHFKNRMDFDATIFWQLKNLGLGNRAEIREQQSAYRQASLRQVQLQDQVIAQVVQAREQLGGWWDRLQIGRSSLFDERGAMQGPTYRSIRLNFERIRGAEGRPLEVQDSIRGLSDTLEAYYQATTDYDGSRFRLLIALGMPADAILNPDLLPMPPPPCEPKP